MQHWTLQKSMFYSNYVASKLGLWRDRSNNKLQTLLARMGLSLVEADQKYANMKGELKKKLPDKLDTVAAEFGLTDVRFPTFKKQRGYGSTIFAADCVHIASAMLHYTQSNDYRWADCFFKAHDALMVLSVPLLVSLYATLQRMYTYKQSLEKFFLLLFCIRATAFFCSQMCPCVSVSHAVSTLIA